MSKDFQIISKEIDKIKVKLYECFRNNIKQNLDTQTKESITQEQVMVFSAYLVNVIFGEKQGEKQEQHKLFIDKLFKENSSIVPDTLRGSSFNDFDKLKEALDNNFRLKDGSVDRQFNKELIVQAYYWGLYPSETLSEDVALKVLKQRRRVKLLSDTIYKVLRLFWILFSIGLFFNVLGLLGSFKSNLVDESRYLDNVLVGGLIWILLWAFMSNRKSIVLNKK